MTALRSTLDVPFRPPAAASSEGRRDVSAPLSPRRSGEHPDTQTGSAADVITWAAKKFGSDLLLSSSFGADSAVMLHLVTRIIPDIRVLLVDTGYLFPETYRYAEELRKLLGFRLHVVSSSMTPAFQEALYGQLWEQGQEGVKRYLELNKVEPMRRALKELGVRAWMSGIRAEQTKHRSTLEQVCVQDGIVKIHPILHFSRKEMDQYLADHQLPRHPLVSQGYRSIGDWHSTIPVLEGDDERAGRLLGSKKECGLHLTDAERTSLDASRL